MTLFGRAWYYTYNYLDALVLRINQADTPLAFAPNLMESSLPTVPKVVRAVKEVMYLVK